MGKHPCGCEEKVESDLKNVDALIEVDLSLNLVMRPRVIARIEAACRTNAQALGIGISGGGGGSGSSGSSPEKRKQQKQQSQHQSQSSPQSSPSPPPAKMSIVSSTRHAKMIE